MLGTLSEEQGDLLRRTVLSDINSSAYRIADKQLIDADVEEDRFLETRPKITIHAFLEYEERETIGELFREFDINFVSSVNQSHAFAATARKLETHLLMRRLNATSDTPVVDFGGNWLDHLTHGRANVHSCCPLLDMRDAARNTERKIAAEIFVDKKKVTVLKKMKQFMKNSVQPNFDNVEKSVHKLLTDTGAVYCNKKAEHCDIKARLGMGIHSIYDMTIETLVESLHRHGVFTFYATFIFDEMVLLKDEGIIRPINAHFVVNKDKDEIRFSFLGDSSNGYIHKFSEYKRFMSTFTKSYKGVTYYFEPMENRGGIQILKVIRVETPLLYPQKTESFRNIWIEKNLERVAVRVFDYNKKAHVNFEKDIVPKVVVVSKKLYEGSLGYAMGLKDSSLTQLNVFNHLKTYNSRIVVNGTDVTSKGGESHDDLNLLSQVIYLKVCFGKYYANQTMDRLTRVEDLSRKLARGGLWNALSVWWDRVRFSESLFSFDSLKQMLVDDMDLESYALSFVSAPLTISYSEIMHTLLTSGEKPVTEELQKTGEEFEKFYAMDELVPKKDWSDSALKTIITGDDSKFVPSFDLDSETSFPASGLSSELLDSSDSTDLNDLEEASESDDSEINGEDICDFLTGDTFNMKYVRYLVKSNDEKKKSLEKTSLIHETGETTDNRTVNSLSFAELNDEIQSFVFDEGDEEKASKSVVKFDLNGQENDCENRTHNKDNRRLRADLKTDNPIGDFRRNEYFAYLAAEVENSKATVMEDWKNVLGRSYLNEKELAIARKTRETDVLKIKNDGTFESVSDTKISGEYALAYNGVEFLELKSTLFSERWSYSCETKSNLLIVNKNVRLLQSKRKLEVLNPRPMKNSFGTVTLVEGVPGCGKTTGIIKRAGPSDLILTVGRETKQDIEDKVEELGKKTKVSTVDSYILNSRKAYDVVWLDEGLMIHPGEIDILRDLTQCRKMFVYGDRNQIPFIARVPDFVMMEKFYSDFSAVEVQNLSYRCPKDVAAILSKHYEKGFKSASKVEKSIQLKTINNLKDVPLGNFQYLTWTQEEKKELRRRGFGNTITVHEAQGKTWNNVCMVRNNTFKLDLFKSEQHALVAISRHRQTFYYVTKASLVGDALADMADKKKVRDALIASQGGVTMEAEIDFTDVPITQDFRLSLTKVIPSDAEDAVEILQDYYDRIFPAAATESYETDSYQVEHSDLVFNLEDCRLDMSKMINNVDKTYKEEFDYRSKLRTGQPLTRPRTMRQGLLTLEKRNLNRPDNNVPCDIEVLKRKSLDRFFETFCHPKAREQMKEYESKPFINSSASLGKWLADFQEKKLKMIEDPELPIDESEFSAYEMMLKTEPKNKLEPGAPFEYPILQNLLVHKKKINAMFSPVFRELFERFSSLLKPSVYCHLRKNVDHLDQHLNDFLDVKKEYKLLEIDQEKFDKSQTEVCFEIEMFFLEKLGLDCELLRLWKDCHKSSTGTNFLNGIKAYLVYQRKTGDAMTCFGNTMISMIALGTVFDLTRANALYFVGDDSFVFGEEDFQAEKGAKDLSLYFNLKGKVIDSNHGFFCSYFFANNGEQFRAVVDPLKRTERLGKHIKLNQEFATLHERFVSYADLAKCYDDASFYDSVSEMVAKRYNTEVNSYRAMEALYALSKNFDLFSSLYEDERKSF